MSPEPPPGPFVMVPVPLEHYDAFMEEVMKMMLRNEALKWDHDSVADLLAGLDDQHREVLRFLCVEASSVRAITAEHVAAGVAMGEADVHAMVERINAVGRAQSKPVLVLVNSQVEPNTFGVSPWIAGLVNEQLGADVSNTS